MWISRIQFTKQSSFIAINKLSKPYRSTEKRIFMEDTRTSNKKGRPAAEGKKRQYVIPDDVHEWIMSHGGSKYIADTFRAIKTTTLQAQEDTSL